MYSSVESGFETDELTGGCSAVKNFYDGFVSKLHRVIDINHEMDLDDPTIDLDIIDKGVMAIRPPSPIQHANKSRSKEPSRQHNYNQSQSHRRVSSDHNKQVAEPKNSHDTFQIGEKRDSSISELRVIVGQIKDNSSYGEKLAAIMLKGLKDTLPSRWFSIFLEEGLPQNFVPIVKMNNDNTPFVEFLIKSELSDQDPFSQLSEYSTQHMALCKFVVQHLQGIATKKQLGQSLPNKHQQQPLAKRDDNRNSLPPMACSTPIAQRKMQSKRRDSLNESQRILPPRACKTAKKITSPRS